MKRYGCTRYEFSLQWIYIALTVRTAKNFTGKVYLMSRH